MPSKMSSRRVVCGLRERARLPDRRKRRDLAAEPSRVGRRRKTPARGDLLGKSRRKRGRLASGRPRPPRALFHGDDDVPAQPQNDFNSTPVQRTGHPSYDIHSNHVLEFKEADDSVYKARLLRLDVSCKRASRATCKSITEVQPPRAAAQAATEVQRNPERNASQSIYFIKVLILQAEAVSKRHEASTNVLVNFFLSELSAAPAAPAD
ncbi:hypothetical protein EVAR_51488_1 [Eumeta japonica]|uniref:Uncharacterized protein n=1 Tax=Eumeta variegata TaxID=151549 RepID=A0A4C1XFE9_EUMVA|nr:hypothetical protein EVAR_51488_1 [Eumeta japonica]